MYLINPLYFISNVIYIRPESKYILIDKPCWNTMVKLIFKGRRPSVAELKQFKELCYSTYVVWMDTKMIDYKSFNAKISQYQLDSEKFRKWSQSVQNAPIVEPVVEIDVNDDTFYEEEFIYEDKTEELNLTESEVTLLNKTTTIKKYEEDAKYIINYNLVRSPQHKSLVEIVGFGKIIALCRLLVQNKSLRFLTSLQQKFFRYNSELVSNALKIYDETLWYSCSVCSTINTHEHHRRFDLEAFNSDHTLNSIEFFYKSRSLRNRKFVIMLPKELDFSLVKFNPVQLKENFFPIIVTVEDKLTLLGMQLYLKIDEPGSHPIEVKVERDIYYYFYQFYMMKYVRETFYDEEAFGFLATQISSWIQRSGHFNRCVYESMIPLIRFFQLDENYFMATFGIDPECLDTKYDNYKEVIKLAQLVNIENPFNAIINVLD